MSSIAMAADSTQGDNFQDAKKKSNKRKKHRSYSTTSSSSSDDSQDFQPIKRHKKKNNKGSRTYSSDSNCESDLDLGKELLPITGYINDKEAMIDNMFRSITSRKLKTMLPEILKPLSTNELKALCLEQLHLMSSKRISKILDGIDPEVISSSASEEDDRVYEEQIHRSENLDKLSKISKSKDLHEHQQIHSKLSLKEKKRHLLSNSLKGISTLSRNMTDPKYIESSTGDSKKPSDHKELNEDAGKAVEKNIATANIDQTSKIKKCLRIEINKIDAIDNAIIHGNKNKEGMSKTQLEILELEMRARAIKAMLKAQENNDKMETWKSSDEKAEFQASCMVVKNDSKKSKCNDNETLADQKNNRIKLTSNSRSYSPADLECFSSSRWSESHRVNIVSDKSCEKG